MKTVVSLILLFAIAPSFSCQIIPEQPGSRRVKTAPQARLRSTSAPNVTAERPTRSPVQRAISPAKSAEFDQFARFIAGRSSADSPFAPLERTEMWASHSQLCNQAWLRLERTQLSRITMWCSIELKEVDSEDRPVFYPFGGPDFLYAHAFFPRASDYILVGLEPAGSIPDWSVFSDEDWDKYLGSLRASMEEILNFTFFRTEDMKEHLENEDVSGLLPILLFFLARTDHRILAIERVYIGSNGEEAGRDDFRHPRRPGRQLMARCIQFQDSTGGPRNLYYFPLDLSNYSLRARPGFAAFLKKRGALNSFVKAASYLMHRPAFSDVRDVLLGQSACLLQDDSGIPIECFPEKDWRMHLYGKYDKPIKLFEARYQTGLEQRYAQAGEVRALPFGFGYRLQADRSNLMLARKVSR
ncbi:MAG: hypothetical protein EHM61_23885 [Acidobacteria bacterium]|nr:MAG: hypothetical protein EHM61_23885 [Acidobacteriota bacterium]